LQQDHIYLIIASNVVIIKSDSFFVLKHSQIEQLSFIGGLEVVDLQS